ncbi:hypothetical protein [Myxococcus hansupus]|uniref:hypothetical protein n=1 Tax=Pseudomyxococcus hansupus TaxID=1297742 RepID=UPI001187543F|nr:hypothetical protein [Myxococcus hansupus]
MMEKKAETEQRIDDALTRLGEVAGKGQPFSLLLAPSDEELDAAVTAEHAWAHGQLYSTVMQYLEQLVANLSKMPKAVGRAVSEAAPQRVVRFSIDSFDGGISTGQVYFNGGRLDLVFRVDALKTNQAGWSDVGLDVRDALARIGKSPSDDEPEPESAPAEPESALAEPESAPAESESAPVEPEAAREEAVSAPEAAPAPSDGPTEAIDKHLAALGEFIGDGVKWRYAWATDAATMDAEVTSHSSDLKGTLLNTLEAFLGHIVDNVRSHSTPEDLAFAAPSRTLVFEFVDIDDCPRQYLGVFQAVIKGEQLYFVGPAMDFNTWGSRGRLGRDLEKAVQAARGESGPTESERRLAESLAAIAGSSSGGGSNDDGAAAASSHTGKPCRACDGTGLGTCNGCHGKGGRCNYCQGSGRSKAKCPSCRGASPR